MRWWVTASTMPRRSLATADVGLAMGAVGRDVAIEAADVALMGKTWPSFPTCWPTLDEPGGSWARTPPSQLILVVLIPLAATGALGLAAVVATHELAELAVIANGIRAGRRAKPAEVANRPGDTVRAARVAEVPRVRS